MRGQVGVFYNNNKQIGGCLNWEITFELNDYIDNKKRVSDWKASATSYWLSEKAHKIKAYFFWIVGGRLVLAYKGELYINSIIEIGGKQTGLIEMTREK